MAQINLTKDTFIKLIGQNLLNKKRQLMWWDKKIFNVLTKKGIFWEILINLGQNKLMSPWDKKSLKRLKKDINF